MNSEETALIIESTSISLLFCFFADNAAGVTERDLVEENTCCFDSEAAQTLPRRPCPPPFNSAPGPWLGWALPDGSPGHTFPRWKLLKAGLQDAENISMVVCSHPSHTAGPPCLKINKKTQMQPKLLQVHFLLTYFDLWGLSSWVWTGLLQSSGLLGTLLDPPIAPYSSGRLRLQPRGSWTTVEGARVPQPRNSGFLSPAQETCRVVFSSLPVQILSPSIRLPWVERSVGTSTLAGGKSVWLF